MARILLADDESATRDLVRRALAGEGHTVIEAQDGGEALDQIKAQGAAIELLISDVQMPTLDGLALADAARRHVPGLRVILMTGFASGLASTDHLKPNLRRVMTKPFSLDDIRSAVRAALN
jgi:DNA-binding NtrC family response regulator